MTLITLVVSGEGDGLSSLGKQEEETFYCVPFCNLNFEPHEELICLKC